MADIKQIIFDLGGVLFDLDTSRTLDSFKEILGIQDPHEFYEQHIKLFHDFEKGKIITENFLWHLQYSAKKVPSSAALIKAWNAMLLGWSNDKIELLRVLREKYPIYLLSNTNILHHQWITGHLKKSHEIEDSFSSLFDKAYLSYELGLKKPDKNIFLHVLQDLKIIANETLYIDDLPENVEIANELGFKAILHPQNGDLSMAIIAGYVN